MDLDVNRYLVCMLMSAHIQFFLAPLFPPGSLVLFVARVGTWGEGVWRPVLPKLFSRLGAARAEAMQKILSGEQNILSGQLPGTVLVLLRVE